MVFFMWQWYRVPYSLLVGVGANLEYCFDRPSKLAYNAKLYE